MFHVKHREQELDSLISYAAEIGVGIDEVTAAELLSHLEWVLETNKTHNLTAIQSMDAGIRLHVVDSVAALPEVQQAPDGEMLDIGTGGGFPGLPLALLSGRPVTLLDSVAKKVRLVGEYAQTRGLQVEIAAVRAEDFAIQKPRHFAIVLARAVSQLPSIVELAAPLLARQGRFVALKGQLSEEELARGDKAARKCGLKRVSIRRFVLPGGSEERTILGYEKCSGPSIALPRRVGLAQKHPLA